ncbi:MAG: hypothetical protein ABH832_01080 [bacterium]
MKQISLNLIPVSKKKRLTNLVKFIFTKDILEMVIFSTALIAVTLMWSWMFLQNVFIDLAGSSISVNKEYLSYNRQIGQINQLMKDMDRVTGTFVSITGRLGELINSIPADIKIKSLLVDRDEKILTMQGTAKTRAGLLSFQEILKKIDWLDQVQTPVSKLFQKDDVDFEFKTKIK